MTADETSGTGRNKTEGFKRKPETETTHIVMRVKEENFEERINRVAAVK